MSENIVKVTHEIAGADFHVYLATPAHTIHSNYVLALVRSIPALLSQGISVTYALLTGHPHVDDARNFLLHDFLDTRCTDLFFLDADVAWQTDAIERLLKHDCDIVGGVYPVKDFPVRFPVRVGAQAANGLHDADMLPTGFLRIRRDSLWPLVKDAPKVGMAARMVPIIFERGSIETEHGLERVGGDANFCRKATAAGFKLYCDPTIIFTHQGPVDFAGRLADHLGERNV